MTKGPFTKKIISLELRVGHTQFIYQQKTLMCIDITKLPIQSYPKDTYIQNLFFDFYSLT